MPNKLPVAVGDEIHSPGGISVVERIDHWIDGTPVATLVDVATGRRRAPPPAAVPVSLIVLATASGEVAVMRDTISRVAA